MSKTRLPGLSACLVSVALVSFPAIAERADNLFKLEKNSRILAYLTGDEASKKLFELGSAWDRKLGLQASCKSQYSVRARPGGIIIHRTIDLPPGAMHPVEGIWQVRFSLERCGESQTYNALVLADNGAAPAYQTLLPGKTIGTPVLLQDVLSQLTVKVFAESKARQNRECDDFIVTDTDLTVPPRVFGSGAGATLAGSYEETWIVRYCGAKIRIPLCFTPKPGGGTSFISKPCSQKQ